MKVMIGIPMYGSMCTAGFTISLANLMMESKNWPNIELIPMFALNESLIPKTRSMIVHAFLKSSADKLLFIDSDISFDALEIFRMLFVEEPIVCGIYPKKNIKWNNIAKAAKSGVEPEQLMSVTAEYLFIPKSKIEPDDRGLVEIDRAGTGMMLIDRSVFDILSDEVPSFKLEAAVANVSDDGDDIKEFFHTTIDPSTKVFLHEDFNFCRMWQNTGGKIYAASWVKLQHSGMYTFG
jgi:hypothetical protein